MKQTPQFLVLTVANCRAILARNHVGRLAFLNHGKVDIEPLGYVWHGRWLFMRSANGTKFRAFAHSPYAAFEVDEVEGPFDWRSVVAHGTIYVLPQGGAPIEQREFARALLEIRKVMPDAFTKDDPTPERRIVYGLNIHELTGRSARS